MIPLAIPHLGGNEWKYIKECLDTNWVSSAGKYVDLFEQKIAEYTGARYATACVNGTAALQVSLRLAGVQPGDEVIAPTLTFIAPINAIAYNGASPIFMDADGYYNIDSAKTIRFIQEETEFKDGFSFNRKTGKRVSAILPVHVWGNACWLDDLVDLCKERNIAIIEDASESLGTRYTQGKFAGRHTGTIGKLGCISFNGNKIITTGGGGMILTDDEDLAHRAHHLCTQAKADPVRYEHDEIGFNFRMTNIQAAMGVAQLEQLPGFIEIKGRLYKSYEDAFTGMTGVELAPVPNYASNNYWMPALRLESGASMEERESLMQFLESEDIQTRPVWVPNHLQGMYRYCQSYLLERAEKLWRTTLCLPSHPGLNDTQIEKVTAGVAAWLDAGY